MQMVRVTALTTILCLIASTSALGANKSIMIDAPSAPVAIGQMVEIPVTGAAPEWFHQFDRSVFPLDGVTWHFERTMPAEEGDPGTPRFIVQFTKPGEYQLQVHTRDADGSLASAKAVIVVGGDDPTPDPPIPPPVPPDAERSYVVIMETGQRTAAEAEMIGKLMAHFKAQEDRYLWRIVDQDIKDGLTNKSPPWLQPYLSAMKAKGLKVPVLMVSVTPEGQAFSVVAVESLAGKTGAEAVALAQKWGG